jgi:hypothetical protein
MDLPLSLTSYAVFEPSLQAAQLGARPPFTEGYASTLSVFTGCGNWQMAQRR